jgi:hypothetical protein
MPLLQRWPKFMSAADWASEKYSLYPRIPVLFSILCPNAIAVYARRLGEFAWIYDGNFSILCPNLHKEKRQANHQVNPPTPCF